MFDEPKYLVNEDCPATFCLEVQTRRHKKLDYVSVCQVFKSKDENVI